MQRFDKFKKMTVEEAANELCLAYDHKGDGCYHCPVFDRCRTGHNGFFDYLMEQVDELKTS